MTEPEATARARTPVLLVGSFHMVNPGLDLAASVDDVLAPRRQTELEELAERLVAFAPTKVAVEARWDNTKIAARYQQYRDGTAALRRGEDEQIGFRVAARLGHDTIWPIHVWDVFFDPEVERLAEADPEHGRRYAGMVAAAKRLTTEKESCWQARPSPTPCAA